MILTLKQQILKNGMMTKLNFYIKNAKNLQKKINNFFEIEPEIEVQEIFKINVSQKKKLSGQ